MKGRVASEALEAFLTWSLELLQIARCPYAGKGSPVRGIQGTAYGNIRTSSSPNGCLETPPRVTTALEEQGSFNPLALLQSYK